MFCSRPSVDTKALQKSWDGIKSSLGESAPETVGMLIFKNLFEDYPKMVSFFKNYGSSVTEIMENKRFKSHAKDKVFGTFDKIMKSLEKDAELSDITSWLAKVHGPKGVTPLDFMNLSQAILKTLGQALGNDFTPELKAAWTSVLTSMMTSISNQLPK